MYYIKLRSSGCTIELQTGQFHRNNIREQLTFEWCREFQHNAFLNLKCSSDIVL